MSSNPSSLTSPKTKSTESQKILFTFMILIMNMMIKDMSWECNYISKKIQTETGNYSKYYTKAVNVLK